MISFFSRSLLSQKKYKTGKPFVDRCWMRNAANVVFPLPGGPRILRKLFACNFSQSSNLESAIIQSDEPFRCSFRCFCRSSSTVEGRSQHLSRCSLSARATVRKNPQVEHVSDLAYLTLGIPFYLQRLSLLSCEPCNLHDELPRHESQSTWKCLQTPC